MQRPAGYGTFLITFLVSGLALLFLSMPVHAQNGAWRISAMHYPPLLYINDEGRFTGSVGETVQKLCQTSKTSCDFSHMPLKRSMRQLGIGSLDATITIDTGKDRPCCLRVRWETPWQAGFFSRLSKPDSVVPKTAGDLIGHNLIVVLGMKSPYGFAPALDQMAADGEIRIFNASTIKSAVDMLMAGRAPLLWGSADFFQHMDNYTTDQRPDFHPRLTYPITIWVRKDNIRLLNALNDAADVLREQNKLDDRGLWPEGS